MRFFVLTLLLFSCLATSSMGAEGVLFPAKTPIFSSKYVDANKDTPLAVLPNEQMLSVTGSEDGYFQQHPLMRHEQFYTLPLPDGSVGYIPANVTVETPFYSATQPLPSWVNNLKIGVGLALFLVVIGYYQSYKRKKLAINSVLGIGGLALIVILLRGFFFLIFMDQVGNFLCSPADDPGYYETATGMLNGSLDGKWSFTVGLGFWYMPFIKLLNAQSYYDIAQPFSYFSALIVAPLTLALLMLTFERITKRPLLAFSAVAIFALLPFIYHWTLLDNHITDSFFSFPDIGGTFFNYNSFIYAGFNTMSDTPCMFTIVLMIYLATILPTRWYSTLILGVLLGGSCLLRMNAIMFAPVVAIIYLLRVENRWSLKSWLTYLGGVLVATLVFGLQLYVNYRQFGSAFTFPYSLHPNRAAEGFEWEFLAINIPYLVEANRAVFGIAVASVWFIKDRSLRLILSWWSLPCLLFFFGYTCTTYDAVRFILPIFPALILISLLPDFWRGEFDRNRSLLALYAGLCAIFLTTTDIWYFQVALALFGVYLFCIWRTERSVAGYIVLLTVISFVPTSWLIAVAFVVMAGLMVLELVKKLTPKV